jgi:pimeloyl-ACP methyl ester carboxylesterase
MVEGTAKGIGYLAGCWPSDPAKSTIFFIHGAGGSSLFWQAQVEGLAARANTIALDLPGHGRSGGNGCDNIEDYGRSVIDFIKALDVSNPVLCGISMGGAITQQILLDFPNNVKAGILMGTGCTLKVAPFIFENIENDYPGFVELLTKLSASKKTDRRLVQPFRDDLAKCQPDVTHGDFRACDRFDVTGRLSKIVLPVLVLTAEDDQLTPPASGEFLAKNIDRAIRVHIMDAGHIAPMEKPEAVNRAIIEFLDQTGL